LLKEQKAIWQATIDGTKDLREMEFLSARVRQSMHDIQTVANVAEERLRIVVELQSRVSKLGLTVSETLEKLPEAKQQVRKRLLYPDGLPIWRAAAEPHSNERSGLSWKPLVARVYSDSAAFLRDRRGLIGGTFVFFVLVLACIRWFARATLKRDASDL